MSGLCTAGQGQSTATVKSNTTVKQDAAQRRENLGIPPDGPDFADNLIQEARKRQASQLITKSNRRDALANNAGAPAPASYSLLNK